MKDKYSVVVKANTVCLQRLSAEQRCWDLLRCSCICPGVSSLQDVPRSICPGGVHEATIWTLWMWRSNYERLLRSRQAHFILSVTTSLHFQAQLSLYHNRSLQLRLYIYCAHKQEPEILELVDLEQWIPHKLEVSARWSLQNSLTSGQSCRRMSARTAP